MRRLDSDHTAAPHLVVVEAIDARKGIDSLAQLCREKLNADPFCGCVFIFRSRRGTAIKILAYDGQGFWLATKRLSKAASVGAQRVRKRRRYFGHIRRNCCWPPATLMRKRRRYGGR
jgi:transposase